MPGYRMDRTSEDIMRELTAILRTVKDPRVAEAMLSIVRVEVSRDLSYATVFISAMEGLDTAKKAVEGLLAPFQNPSAALLEDMSWVRRCGCGMCRSCDLWRMILSLTAPRSPARCRR